MLLTAVYLQNDAAPEKGLPFHNKEMPFPVCLAPFRATGVPFKKTAQ